MGEEALKRYPAKTQKMSIAGADHLLVTPATYSSRNENRLVVYVHGGAHTLFSPESTLIFSAPAAHYLQAKVLAVRYPLAWQKPHPASRDRVVAVYKELLKSYAPRHIAMFGDSAGGGLLMSAVHQAPRRRDPNARSAGTLVSLGGRRQGRRLPTRASRRGSNAWTMTSISRLRPSSTLQVKK